MAKSIVAESKWKLTQFAEMKHQTQGHLSFVIPACRGTQPNAEWLLLFLKLHFPSLYWDPFCGVAFWWVLFTRVFYTGQDWGCLRYEMQAEGSYSFKDCSYVSRIQDKHMASADFPLPQPLPCLGATLCDCIAAARFPCYREGGRLLFCWLCP